MEQSKTSAPVFSQVLQLSGMKFGVVLKLVELINLKLCSSHSISSQGREVY